MSSTVSVVRGVTGRFWEGVAILEVDVVFMGGTVKGEGRTVNTRVGVSELGVRQKFQVVAATNTLLLRQLFSDNDMEGSRLPPRSLNTVMNSLLSP